jgi:hypothetical protein
LQKYRFVMPCGQLFYKPSNIWCLQQQQQNKKFISGLAYDCYLVQKLLNNEMSIKI